MFICAKCLAKDYKNIFIGVSVGPCEICRKESACADIPSRNLILVGTPKKAVSDDPIPGFIRELKEIQVRMMQPDTMYGYRLLGEAIDKIAQTSIYIKEEIARAKSGDPEGD